MQILKISLAKIFRPIARRRNIEMEKNELSRIPDPDDPNDPVMPTDNANSNIGNNSGSALINTFKERVVPKINFFERRNNNDLESSSSKHEKHQPNDTKINIPEVVRHCCIYKVPNHLRKINKEAYTPQVISIGPLHHGNKALVEMERQKLIYISEFQKTLGEEKLMRFKSFIMENEQLIRDHYEENSSFESSDKFVNMILHDAVFIIVFFLKNDHQVSDFCLDTPYRKAAITRDLQLLENQLPYFVLKNLFEIAILNFTKKDNPDHDRFLILSHQFFFNPKEGVPKPKNKIQYEIQHFTDLRRYFLLMDFPPRDQKQGEVRNLPTAAKLHGSGVMFNKGIQGRSSLEISCKYVNGAKRIPRFKGSKFPIPFVKELQLQIPRFEIDDKTEWLYRNLMALELCRYPAETHICNFILLMNFLIKTKKDVDLLVDQRIIFSCLDDNAEIVKMLKKLSLQITASPSIYHSLGEKLKAHYDSNRHVRSWNRDMATLKIVYFRDIWTGSATVAAIILLVLTFIQAVCSILSLL